MINQRQNLINVIRNIINPSGITRYNVTYIPRFHAYKITLIASSQTINAQYIANIINDLEAQGFKVLMKPQSSLFRKVITLYVIPRGVQPR